VILSMIFIVSVGVKSINVVCPHDGTYDLCISAVFSKTGFLDIVPLCCQPSTYTLNIVVKMMDTLHKIQSDR